MARTYKQTESDLRDVDTHHAIYGRNLSRNAREDVDAFLTRANACLDSYLLFDEVSPETREQFLADTYRLISRAWLRYQAQEQFA